MNEIKGLSHIVNFKTMRSIETGQPVFLRPVKFFCHLLAFGPVVSMEHLNKFVVYRDLNGETKSHKHPTAKYLRDEVFTYDMNWDPEEPELGQKSSQGTRHHLFRISMALPNVKLNNATLSRIAQVTEYSRTRYNVSPKTLAYFLRFGEVRRVRHEDPLDYNPLRVSMVEKVTPMNS